MFEDTIFETHAHYDDAAFDADREELLASLPAHGIGCVVDVTASVASHEAVLALTEKFPFVYGTVGVHPDEIGELNDEVFSNLAKLCSRKKVAAVGEIGMDYHWNKENKEQQRYWFSRFLQLAREQALPAIIHSREAAEDTLAVLKEQKAGEIGAVMHCYSYSKEYAKQILDMGMYFGIGGVLTFKNARKLVETVEYIPLSSILLETDCPYLAPVPYRGKRNCSLYIPYVVERIALLKGISEEEVIRATNENARRFFKKIAIDSGGCYNTNTSRTKGG